MGEPYRPNGVASDRAREAFNQLAAVQIDRHHAHAETDLPTQESCTWTMIIIHGKRKKEARRMGGCPWCRRPRATQDNTITPTSLSDAGLRLAPARCHL